MGQGQVVRSTPGVSHNRPRRREETPFARHHTSGWLAGLALVGLFHRGIGHHV